MSELRGIDPRFNSANSAAEILGKIQSTLVNENGTLTAVIHAYRDLYFIVDFFPNGDLMAIMEIQGTDIQRHPDSSMLNAVVKEQIRYSYAKEALVDTFSARIPLTVLKGADTGDCCTVDGGCCGDAAAQAGSSDDEEDHHSHFLTIEAEAGQHYEITMSLPSEVELELRIEG